MKQSNIRKQIIILVSALVLLITAYYFDVWQDWLKEKANTTLEQQYFAIKLWSVPLAALFFSVCWLLVLQKMRKNEARSVAALLLATGIGILMYPTVSMTFHMTQVFGISVDYFGSSLFFFSSALVAAIGLGELLFGVFNKEPQAT